MGHLRLEAARVELIVLFLEYDVYDIVTNVPLSLHLEGWKIQSNCGRIGCFSSAFLVQQISNIKFGFLRILFCHPKVSRYLLRIVFGEW